MKPSRIDYCQYLISTQKNYTMTHMSDHLEKFSHDSINRYLEGEKITARMIWEHVKDDIVKSPNGYIIFDDSVLNKEHSNKIELVKLQYSGNAHGLIKGIGMVNCVFVNPETKEYWIVDYRIYDFSKDGKSKLDHVRDMLGGLTSVKNLPFRYVLMDSWYADQSLLQYIAELGKIYYCPLKKNRQVDDSEGTLAYRRIDSLNWSEYEKECGKVIKIKKFPAKHKVKLFRVEVSTNRTDWVVTNDLAQNSLKATQKACGLRWKVEQFHRELKQNTGIEKCQARKARIQRNHIGCAVLVWIRLTALAKKMASNIYALKNGMWSDYLRNELRNPSVRMELPGG